MKEMNSDEKKSISQFLLDGVRGYSDAPPELIRSEKNSTGFSSIYEKRGQFCAAVYVFNFLVYLGTYHSVEEAAKVYAIAKKVISAPGWYQSAERHATNARLMTGSWRLAFR